MYSDEDIHNYGAILSLTLSWEVPWAIGFHVFGLENRAAKCRGYQEAINRGYNAMAFHIRFRSRLAVMAINKASAVAPSQNPPKATTSVFKAAKGGIQTAPYNRGIKARS